MNITPDKIERLIFVKYLLRQAEQNKNLERPLSSTSILTLHDAVESFLQLAFEQLTGKSKPSGHLILDTYADRINEVLLTEKKIQINKAFIKRINELRNQLKHSTIFIDQKNIQNLYSETEIFLIDFSSTIFNLPFENISLLNLIKSGVVKDYLSEAKKNIQKKSFQAAIFSIGKAFYELEDDMVKVKDKHGRNLMAAFPKINYLIKYMAGINQPDLDSKLEENLTEIADDINHLHEELHDLKKIVSLSVDVKDYKKFKVIMPYITKIQKGDDGKIKFWIPNEEMGKKVDYEFSQVKFCFDFVTELALRHEQ